MERDFLAAIGKEQQHPHKEKAAGAEESGMLPGLLSPPAAAGFLICARTEPCLVFLPCLVGSLHSFRRDAAWVRCEIQAPPSLPLPCFFF